MVKNVGYGIEAPSEVCNDLKCPFHGEVKVRGRSFEGVVVKDAMTRTVVVEWSRIIKLSKYKRYMYKRSKVSAHNPECINAKKGDKVLIMETRPLSKTKKFAVVKVV